MELVGWEATGPGRTRVEVRLADAEATVRLQLPAADYEVPPEQWRLVASAYGWFASPWKLVEA